MARVLYALLALTIVAAPASGQGLRDKIDELFIFGSGGDPLFLSGTADPNNPTSIQVHGTHFVPSAVESNGTLISFLSTAIGSNITNLPISATSSGRTFRFEGGAPVATSTSPGPVFAERAQTLGRGRVLVGASMSVFKFKSVRGVPLDNIQLNFTHQNVDFAGCDSVSGGDCSLMGIPTLENDVIALTLDLNVDVTSTIFLLSYGLLDWVDVSVAVPIISTSLRGTSAAQVVPFGGPQATHFFEGTPTNAELSASRFVEGSATGLGDVAARLKIRLGQSQTAAFAILGDARFATGSEVDLLGSGRTSVRGLGIVSAQFGAFAPHANVGYVYREGDLQNDALLATLGFDHMLSNWAALAVEVISELQVGESQLTVPDPVTIDVPFRRTIDLTNIPNRRDDIINGSVGMKFVTSTGLRIIANALFPLNTGGLRPSLAWTAGLEYNF
ncbi:MAG: hypothetical protein OEO20_08180 [Gemmatimonadota bacterium]|nr:hypothetical protein [Gemmatimonadota bacterium]MDH3368723.1 hypothetical protein [Gemmatimonadota bacterium]MDH3478264.1 hypothetical protein [Gemmatimonadota bacterium]MDH5549813.1 hypothetical protein [Gemmatimonadota bacterium]